MKNLIVAADDFGLSKSINEGIVRAREEGIVTSINLIPAGEAFDGAVRYLKDTSAKEAGCHLSLTEIPFITGKRHYKGYFSLFIDILSRRIGVSEIYAELKAQMDRLKDTSLALVNLSSHEHVHMAPGLLGIFVRLADEYGIPSIRRLRKEKMFRPFSISKAYRSLVSAYLDDRADDILERSHITSTDHMIGFLDSGSLNDDIVIGMLESLEEGTTELVTHPGFLGPEVLSRHGFHKGCEAELVALTGRPVKKAVMDNGIRLITYGEFISGR